MKSLAIILSAYSTLSFGFSANYKAVLEGDILSKQDQKESFGLGNKKQLWKNGVIPYVIEKDYHDNEKIYKAMADFEKKTGLKFLERTTEKDYIYIQDTDRACYSFIGRVGGKQTVNIHQLCPLSSAIHEFGHAAGLMHEHTRPDRDDYITVLWDNIIKDKRHNFKKRKHQQSYVLNKEFDYESIMIYESNCGEFAIDSKKPCLVKKDGSEIFRSIELSKIDAITLNTMYGFKVEQPEPEQPDPEQPEPEQPEPEQPEPEQPEPEQPEPEQPDNQEELSEIELINTFFTENIQTSLKANQEASIAIIGSPNELKLNKGQNIIINEVKTESLSVVIIIDSLFGKLIFEVLQKDLYSIIKS